MFRVIAFTVKPRVSADTRYRILQYVPFAEKSNIKVKHYSLMTDRFFQWQIENRHLIGRILLLPWLLIMRLWEVLVEAPRYDAVWISREMAPLGPPIFERLLVWRCRRVIMDVDDALHIVDSQGSRWLSRMLRDHGKYGGMAAKYSIVVCGNDFLAKFYESNGAKTSVIPTVVDSDAYGHVNALPNGVVRIGWIGTPLNRHHVEIVSSALETLALARNFELILVGIIEPFKWEVPNIKYVRWNLASELDYFSEFDIGIMPLKDSQFAKGKCAFKLIQYMAAGIPVVASSVGANSEVVHHGEDGFLATTKEDWVTALQQLIDDKELRRSMGQRGRELVRARYSVQSRWTTYRSILLTGKP